MKKINKTTLFILLTFGICLILAGIFKLSLEEKTNKIAFTAFGVIYMFIPMICAIIVQKIIYKGKIIPNLYISFKINRWFSIAWLIPLVMCITTIFISLLFPNIVSSSEMNNSIWIRIIKGLTIAAILNSFITFGEELAWRGFLLSALRELSFIKASVIIGIIWGIWHIPLILLGLNYPQHPIFGILLMTIACILLTPLFLYITIKSKSVIAATLMHGTINGIANITKKVIDGGNDLTVGFMGLSGIFAVLVILLGLFIYDYKIGKEKIMFNKINNYL